MAGLLAQMKPMFVLQGLSCGLMFALMVIVLGSMVLVAAAVAGADLDAFSGRGKKHEQRQKRGQDRQNQQQQRRQRIQQMQQRRADALRRRQLAQQRLSMQRRHQ